MCCHSPLSSLMSNRVQLRVLLVITRLELPSTAVSPALTTSTESGVDCTVTVRYRGAGRISLILEQYYNLLLLPSYTPYTSDRSHDIVFYTTYCGSMLTADLQSGRWWAEIYSYALSQSEGAQGDHGICQFLSNVGGEVAWCNLVR